MLNLDLSFFYTVVKINALSRLADSEVERSSHDITRAQTLGGCQQQNLKLELIKVNTVTDLINRCSLPLTFYILCMCRPELFAILQWFINHICLIRYLTLICTPFPTHAE